MGETLDYLKTFASFPLSLRRFARQRLSLADARRTVRQRLAQREASFLAQVERNIYGHPASPYRALLERAGCGMGDLRALVNDRGLEGALGSLRDAGVFVTFEEFKGRRPIERPGMTLPVTARDFDNPHARRHFTLQTGGSTGAASLVGQDLDYIAATAPNRMLSLAAHDLLGLPLAHSGHILPAGGLRSMLQHAYIGQMPERWFCPVGWRSSRYWLKYDLASFYMILWMRLHGLKVPLPEFARPGQALAIARWAHATLRRHPRCLVNAGVSRSLRISTAALEAGLDLTGAVFRGGGEPTTPAKVERIRRSGAKFVPGYGMMEVGYLAFGCARPADVSDVHLYADMVALITHPHSLEAFDVTVPAFNLTALLDTAPKVMLNVQMDDFGLVEERKCGCELEALGYTVHLSQIRSYSKLTGEGVTLIGNEILRILEDQLPARFGGTSLDYQLLEEEDSQGLTRLYLVVSPRLAIADEGEIVAAMLKALRDSSPMADAARTVWQQAQTLRVRRAEPSQTARGRTPPLVIRRPVRDA